MCGKNGRFFETRFSISTALRKYYMPPWWDVELRLLVMVSSLTDEGFVVLQI